MFLHVLSALVALTTAQSGCRCGDAAYLAIPRVNLSATEQIKPCAPYSKYLLAASLRLKERANTEHQN
jgi:hypothetical protein